MTNSAASSLSRTTDIVEKSLCYTALVLMALVPVADIVLRLFNIFIPFSRHFMVRLFLVSSLLAAMLTTKGREHISITLVQYIKNESLKKAISSVAALLSAFIATIMFWDSISFVMTSFTGRTTGFFIDDRFFALVMPIAYGVMAIRFAAYSVSRGGAGSGVASSGPASSGANSGTTSVPGILLAVFIIVLGSAAAFPAIAKILWGFDPPEVFFAPLDFLYDSAFYLRIPLILLLVVAGLTGTPIFVVIGGIAIVMLRAAGSEPEVAPIHVFSSLTDADLIAIPLFTLTGFFLSESKAGERLVAAFRGLFSWMPGGLIIATVIICAFFTSFTGASGVTILALGGILFIILQKAGSASGKGYQEKFSIGLLTSAGGIGVLFPPSLPIILVATTVNSILFFMGEPVEYTMVDFFLGAIIPGLILVAATIIYGIFSSMKQKIPVEPFNLKKTGSAVKSSAFEILLPVILIVGFFSGILSLVEVSAVSVVYVFIVEVFIHRDIALKDVPKVFFKALPIIGGVLSIFAMAGALSFAIVASDVPQNFAFWMQHAIESKYVFLLLLNLSLFLIACVMDIFSAILVLLPLIVPLAQAYGIDPVHLGIIFIVNLEAGFLTPPVGMNLFLATYRFKKPFAEICRNVLPFLAVRIGVVLLVTYIPALSTALVRLFN